LSVRADDASVPEDHDHKENPMSTPATTTHPATAADDNDVVTSPAPTHRRSRRLRFRLAALAVALIAGLGVLAGPTSDPEPAGAALVGPDAPVNFAAFASGTLVCHSGRVFINPYTSVSTHYDRTYQGQYVQWRYFVASGSGHSIVSNWSGNHWLRYLNYGSQQIGNAASFYAPLNTVWAGYIQVRYWDPYQRIWREGNWTKLGVKQQGYSDWLQYCWT